MPAQIIDGKVIAQEYEEGLKEMMEIHDLHPTLAIISSVETDDASRVYLRNKEKACKRLGIECLRIPLEVNDNLFTLTSTIMNLNHSPNVSGIIVQLPLPDRFDVKTIQEMIDPIKDVDGFSSKSHHLACTPEACLRMLARLNFSLAGKHCVVIGRSKIVGQPLAKLLLDNNATVTVCHSKTPTEVLSNLCREADFVFTAAGVPNLILPQYLKYGAVLIDISINRDENGKLCGDAHPDCANVCSYISPVPGGVGPMTVNTLMYHTIMASLELKQNAAR